MQLQSKNSLTGLRKSVFWPPFTLLFIAVIFSFYDVDKFLLVMTQINNWILQSFDWLFSYVTLSLVVTLVIIYFSPLGKVKIGGENAVPLLSKWKWFSITLCTTLATGILFWAVAEPMYHMASPPMSLDLVANSLETRDFTMATMFMHWSFSPYAIYCVPSLVFALCYYNLNKPFTISSFLVPTIGQKAANKGANVIDAVALFALVAGMASSLGTGILVLSGGIEAQLAWHNGKLMMAGVAVLIVFTFVFSAVSGLHKGIARLSSLNANIFLFFCVFVFVFGPTIFIVSNGYNGLVEYLSSFMQRSTRTLTDPSDNWVREWTVFYFANWYAWAPIAALFLGRIAKGYSVRQFITVNLILPSCCAVLWMSTFAGSAIYFDNLLGGVFQESLATNGPESLIYMLFENLPFSSVMAVLLIIITFISFVTAADSNTDAMSRLCTSSDTLSEEAGQTSMKLKFVWGITIGIIAWVMISFASLDGIRMMNSLGGLPALFIILISNISLFVLLRRVLKSGKLTV